MKAWGLEFGPQNPHTNARCGGTCYVPNIGEVGTGKFLGLTGQCSGESHTHTHTHMHTPEHAPEHTHTLKKWPRGKIVERGKMTIS